MKITEVAVAAGLIGIAAIPASAQDYKFRSIKYRTDPTEIRQVSKPKVSCGDAFHYLKNGAQTYSGFTLTGHTKTFLSDPNETVDSTQCNAINTSGTIVGLYQSGNTFKGYVDNGGIFTDIVDPKAVGYTEVTAINNKGKMVGNYGISNTTFRGFIFDGATYHDVKIGDGSYYAVQAQGINDKGQITGYYEKTISDTAHAYLLDGKNLTDIVFPGSGNSVASQINNRGQVAVEWQDSKGIYEGGVYDSATSTYDVIDVPGTTGGTTIEGIDDQQTIGGYSIKSPGAVPIGFIGTGKLDR